MTDGPALRICEGLISDRGSRYAAAGCDLTGADPKAEVQAALKALKRNKKFAKATHNSWAVLTADGPLKGDDGEAGAGAVILRALEAAGARDHLVIVTRWFGGVQLGGDRFRHVAEAARLYLSQAGVPR